MTDSTVMTPSTTTITSRPRVSSRRLAFCGVAALAVLAAAGCGKSRRSYPTISAVTPDGGSVKVRGTYNHCPQIFYSATPDHADVGQTIALSASASDQENDPLTYTWSATAGTIDKPDAVTTTFHCTARGSVTISLTVSDGECDSKTSGDVLCQSADAGGPDAAGGAGAGGSIGGAGTAGAGGQAGASGQAGTSGGTAGTTGTAGATGAGGSVGTGSGGAVGVGGTTGGSGTGGSGACVETNAPPDIAPACTACLTLNWTPATDGCCALTDAAGKQLCQVAAACMRAGGATGPCVVNGDVSACFCGTNSLTCDNPGQANGPCASQMTAAAGRNVVTMATDSPTPAQVIARQGDSTYALGRASNIINDAGLYCPAECGF
jgi:hypothetical protein